MIRPALLAALLALPAAPASAQSSGDPLDRGAGHFLSGRLDSAIHFFSGTVKENPKDARAAEILGYCLAIKGKDALRVGRSDEALPALQRAAELLPANREIRALALLAELENDVPTPAVPVSTGALDTAAFTGAVFDCLFGEGACAKSGRYVVHVVLEGETMAEIAIKYFQDMTRWEIIWGANPQLPNPHRLEKGTRLLIPLP